MDILTIVTSILLTYGLMISLEAKMIPCYDAEPPIIRSKIPFVGHFLGLIRFGASYYRILREQNELSIFTIALASQKVYVVNSPALISQIYRRPRVLDSDIPFLNMTFKNLFAFHDIDMKLLLGGSLRQDTKFIEHALLARGTASMSDIFHRTMESFGERLDGLAVEGPATIHLQSWLQTILPLSTADGIFGKNNHLANSTAFLDRFWQFDRGLKGLTMSPFASLTSPGPTAAREALMIMFKNLLSRPQLSDLEGTLCELLHETTKLAKHYDRDTDYIARYYFAVYTAFIINTVPVTFWTVAHIVKDLDLLSTVRSEVFSAIELDSRGANIRNKPEPREVVLDTVRIRQRCPTLQLTLEETLRYISSSISTLAVKEDVLLDNEYLLKKGALVQIAATAIHSNPQIWGPNAAAFDVSRSHQIHDKQIHPSAFRIFGGGSGLCPGRHLARDEILAFAAMFIYIFDVEAVGKLPAHNSTDMLSVMKPEGDMWVTISRREGVGPLHWRFRDI
ncbi:putative cytochrome P450 [Xylariaceae sp. FL1272]|nr:putative cytochrome P450 [Xylariaceae sp. FL1272]